MGSVPSRLPRGTPEEHSLGPAQDQAATARSLAFLFASGATLALVSLLLPHSPRTDETGILVTLAVAYTIAAALRLGSARTPRWVVQATLASGTVLITSGAHFSDPDKGGYAFFYIWVGLYAAYFSTRAQAAVQLLFMAVAYGALLHDQEGGSANLERWLIASGTVVVVALWIAWLKGRVEALITRLADAARTDPLTALMNRRGFQESIELELERARRGDRPLTMVLGDLDHFKLVNDRFGHQAGDAALVRVAGALDRSKRRIDIAARMGGEEFALLIPDTDARGAYVLAERVRRAVHDVCAHDPQPLTISLGIATFPADASTPDDLLRVADEALYAAKQLGRDRSVIYSSQLTASLAEETGRTERQDEANVATVLALAQALDIRDAGTARHSEAVGRHAAAIATALGLPAARIERVRLAGLVHDVGKIGVGDTILRKPGPLDDEEWAEMRKHPEIGARILGGKGLDDISAWVLAHHERPDGLGYPYGLRDEQIPLEAKIVAVADAYEAMTASRVYREALSLQDAAAELQRGAGHQFDVHTVQAFLGGLAPTGAGV